MTRTTMGALLGLLVAQGCIIYEDRVHHLPNEDSGSGWGSTTPGPVTTADLRLTVAEGLPGEDLLSTLVNVGHEPLDLLSVNAVTFSRDVQVVDLLARSDEVVLLIHVDDNAEPGAVDVSVTSVGGNGWILEQPFTVLDPNHPGCPPTTTGTTSTEDTGCP